MGADWSTSFDTRTPFNWMNISIGWNGWLLSSPPSYEVYLYLTSIVVGKGAEQDAKSVTKPFNSSSFPLSLSVLKQNTFPSEGNGGAFKELQQRLNSRMEKIENYPHYRSMAFADDDDDEADEGSNNQHDGDYQRVVFDEDGLVHSKHMKYKHRLR